MTLPLNGQNINIIYFYCHKTGHIAMNCRNKLNDEMKAPTLNKPQGIIATRKLLVGYKPFTSKENEHIWTVRNTGTQEYWEIQGHLSPH